MVLFPNTLQLGLLFLLVGVPFAEGPQVAIRATSSLVLLDVIARDEKTDRAIDQLTSDDLTLTDNGVPVSVASFDRSPRPITIWFVMICNESLWDDKKWYNEGSTFFAGKSETLRPALEHLNVQDRLAVAHWCDYGSPTIDAAPTPSQDRALAAIENVLRRPSTVPVGKGNGVFALRQMMQLISDVTHTAKPRSTPVIVFIYGDSGGMSHPNAELITDDLYEMSGIVYALNNGKYDGTWDKGSGQHRIAQFWSSQTGGRLFSTKKEEYGTALDQIIEEAHTRYQLGFVPQSLDGQWHRLRLELSDQAKMKYGSMSLRYRYGYKAVEDGTPTSGLAPLPAKAAPLPVPADADASKSVRVRFGADVKSTPRELHAATVLLGIDRTTLSWSALPDGTMGSVVRLVITSLTDDDRNLGYQVRAFELTRPKADPEASADALFRLSFSMDLPPETKKIRFRIQDEQSEHVGIIEVPRQVVKR